ncbi:PAS domain S-box protein [Deferribacter autotrophicus]|uniref:histidine kinase n=1 Tax=Deferribacter autotrophicus TaxID=500465 RepID=A0A5A8F8X3_9BACT|nr:PAS domain-containing hybrid sensor histidine kinase/response regulator [Deferribacter autotrophicus]KAA0259187.1 PAS domain S-box protein [Deferribacter autotrophicus]
MYNFELKNYKYFLEHIPYGIIITKLDGSIIFANDKISEILKVEKNDLLYKKSFEFYVSLDDREKILNLIAKDGYVTNYRLFLKRSDGEKFPALITVTKYVCENEQIEGLMGIINDISDLYEKDKNVHLFAEIVNKTPHFVLITDKKFNILHTNNSLRKFLKNQVLKIDELPFFDNFKTLKEKIITCLKKDDYFNETSSFVDEGKKYYLTYVVFKIEFEEEDFYVFIFKDITYQIMLEEELAKKAKFEALERMVRGFAHRINNDLTGIITYTNLCQNRLGGDSEINLYLDKIEEIADGIAALIDKMMFFIQIKDVSKDEFRVDKAINELLQEYKEIFGSDIRIDTEFKCKCYVSLNKEVFKNIIFSLIMNSIEAFQGLNKDEKIIRISVDEYVFENQNSYQLKEGSYAKIEIYDNASGIREEDLDKIFDPFFTTKKLDRSMGLGLSMVYGYIKDNGGIVTVESKYGEYTKFTIFLPVIEKEDINVYTADDSDIVGRIFVLDDEEIIVLSLKEFLTANGYEVVSATSLNEAIRMLDELNKPFDLIISDIMLDDGKGYEFVKMYQERFGFCNVIYVSGFIGSEVPDLPGVQYEFIKKPFRLPDILQKVEKLLDN